MAGELALLDTGVLVAFLHRDDTDHDAAEAVLRGLRGELLTTEAVLTERVYLLSRTAGGPQVPRVLYPRRRRAGASHPSPRCRAASS